jgi:hypothetical protein
LFPPTVCHLQNAVQQRIERKTKKKSSTFIGESQAIWLSLWKIKIN